MEKKYTNVKPNKQGVINDKAILNEAYSMNDIDRYGILKDRIQERLGVSSKQAENYLKPFADGNSLNVEASREVNNKLKADVQLRTERIDRKHEEALKINEQLDRYGILKDRVQEQLGISSKQAENYLKPFADENLLSVEASREVNNKLKADMQLRTERMEKQRYEDARQKRRQQSINDYSSQFTSYNDSGQMSLFEEPLNNNKVVEKPKATNVNAPVHDNQLKMRMDNKGNVLNYTDRKAARVHKKEVDAAFERAVMADDGINNIINSAPKNAMGQPMLNKRQAEMIKALKGQENTAFPSMTAPQFTKRHGEIPTEAKAFKQSQNAARKKIQQQSVNQAKKEIAEAAAKKTEKMAKLGKVGKIAAGVGITAAIVSNMNKSKGQQSNAELYGQRTPYGY